MHNGEGSSQQQGTVTITATTRHNDEGVKHRSQWSSKAIGTLRLNTVAVHKHQQSS
jgi:hypothetical protein